MSRTTFIVTLVLAAALVLMPGFLERYRRVRRALGAVIVFWISRNLFVTSLHFTGLGSEGSLQAVTVVVPILLTALWLFSNRQGRPLA